MLERIGLRARTRACPVVGLALLFAATLSGCRTQPASRVVVYCALDREFSQQILNAFTEETGVAAVTKFDTESTKSVGLYQDLISEAEKPRCDVFWNNEIINTIRLHKEGLLQPYASPSAEPFPEIFKAKDRSWHAFASRARILIANNEKVPKEERPRSVLDLTKPKWSGRVAMAKPEFGTTATQAACLFQVWGRSKAKQFYTALKKNDVKILSGNKQVAVAVGRGAHALGFTDTDDAMAEVRAGNPVTLIFPDSNAKKNSDLGTLFIPNTISLIKNGPNPENGRKLIDYLLSAEVEARLAQSASCQIPLNPQVNAKLPPAMQPARTATPLAVDFEEAAGQWDTAQEFLRSTFAY